MHHVTAISGPARRNVDFYTRVLGLRLVKKTVNFDDPGTYHLYYGDADGAPGTILTFFPWEHVAPGRVGIGQTEETAFRVPAGSIGYWTHRLVAAGIAFEAPAKVFGETVLPFRDPDGMRLALVGVAGAEAEPAWAGSEVPAEHAVRGFHGVTLMLRQAAPTARVLTEVFGWAETGREGSLTRYAGTAGLGGHVTLREVGDFLPGRSGGGSVHHIAFRAADDAGQAEMAERAEALGLQVTGAARPQLLPLGLFPRAGRRAVRDRHRRARLFRRRAGGGLGRGLEAPGLPRAAPGRNRAGAAGAGVSGRGGPGQRGPGRPTCRPSAVTNG